MQRLFKVTAISLGVILALATAAIALEQTNGTGKINSGNSIGYNAKCTMALVDRACPKGHVTGHLTFEANGPLTYVGPGARHAAIDQMQRLQVLHIRVHSRRIPPHTGCRRV